MDPIVGEQILKFKVCIEWTMVLDASMYPAGTTPEGMLKMENEQVLDDTQLYLDLAFARDPAVSCEISIVDSALT